MNIKKTGGVTIITDTIRAGQRHDRQSRERETVNSMVSALFGEPLSIGHTPDGAPYLPGHNDIHISISHSSTQAVVALSTTVHPIGIDTETLRSHQLERIIDRYLSQDEQTEWTTPTDHLIAWCIKEAAYKSSGTPGLDLTRDISINRDKEQVTVPGRTLSYIIVERNPQQATVLVTPC